MFLQRLPVPQKDKLTEPKLVAADQLGVRVVIVRRPLAVAGIPSVDNVASAAGWARAQSSGTS